MNINDIVSTLVERIYLAEDLEKIDTEFVSWLNSGARNLTSQFLSTQLVAKITTATDKTGQLIPLSKPEIIANLNRLRVALKDLPTLEIVISFIPDREFEESLGVRIKNELSGLYRIKFSTNIDLIAGAQIGFKGKFKDYSLLKKFD